MKSSRQTPEQSLLEIILNNGDGDIAFSKLLPHLSMHPLIQLSRTNKGIHGLFAKPTKLREALLDQLMPHLANIIVNKPDEKNIEELKKMLNIYPELLTRKIKKVIIAETGQEYINYSLLQLAAAEGDDELTHDLKPFFKLVMGSDDAAREEIDRQLNEKFAAESEEEQKQMEASELDIKNRLAILQTAAIQAITNEKFNNGEDSENKPILSPTTLTAINTYRRAFDALQPKKIHKGRRYRLNTLQETYDAYIQAEQQWGKDYKHNKRCILFEDGVLSHVLLYTPENDAERFNQGVHFLLQKSALQPEQFRRCRTTRIKTRDGTTYIGFYDQLRSPSYFSGLSGRCFDVAFGSDAGGLVDLKMSSRAIKTYTEQKLQTYKTYTAAGTTSDRDNQLGEVDEPNVKVVRRW